MPILLQNLKRAVKVSENSLRTRITGSVNDAVKRAQAIGLW